LIRILHLSDPHFGAADSGIARIFLKSAAAMKPDLVILSGDLSMRARRSELHAARHFVNELPQPTLVIPGNHDIPLINQPFDRFFRPFKRYQELIAPELEPELTHRGVHVVSLNSTRAFGLHTDWSEGRLCQRQLTRMEQQFLGSPPGHFRILVLHHPLLELQVAGRQVVKPLKELMESIENSRVDLVMCGHFHRSQILAVGLTDQWRAVISQAPTVCSTRLQGEPQGFHEILLDAEVLRVTHHVFESGNFVPAGSPSFVRRRNGWLNAAAH
jgi:3',5'-cyclic AMP phosphodiesterase CpdA